MADFAPPAGPPPPRVPEGWKAQWNDQYKEWFFVNIYTKKSQWDKPTEPAYPAGDAPPPGAPPGYTGSSSNTYGDTKNNPYGASMGGAGSVNSMDEDARLAAKLQAEEDARARSGAGSRGAMEDYQNTPMPQTGYGQSPQPLPPREEKRGLFSKLLGKTSGGGSSQQYGQQPQYGGGYPQQQQHYGGGYPPQQQYPPQGYGGGYGGPPPQGYGGGYGGGYQQQQQQMPQKSGGMGAMGGAALGLGGGLIGGMLLEDAIDNHDQSEYQQGYDQGQDNNDNGGGDDYGGGDDGGGDY